MDETDGTEAYSVADEAGASFDDDGGGGVEGVG